MKKKPASAPGKTKKPTKTLADKFLEQTASDPEGKAVIPEGLTGLTIQGAEVVFIPGKTDSPPISKPSAPKADWEFTGSWTGKTDGDQDEAFPTPFPTEAHTDGQADNTSGQNAGETDAAGTQDSAAPLSAADDLEKTTGDVAFLEPSSDSNSVDKSDIIELDSRASRLPGEGRGACHERLRRLARASGMPRGQGPGTAYNWAFDQCNRLFAKPIEPIPGDPPAEPAPDPEVILPNFGKTADPEPPSVAVAPAPIQDDQGVSGLSDLPPGWPELPANAQLQVEIAWVTANRLRVRDGTGVNLSRALSPAPSYSALSWLETSILFPAKFADISVKATATQDDEREHIRREKMAIEEIRGILGEMLEAKD